jgi:hypothetical protein
MVLGVEGGAGKVGGFISPWDPLNICRTCAGSRYWDASAIRSETLLGVEDLSSLMNGDMASA